MVGLAKLTRTPPQVPTTSEGWLDLIEDKEPAEARIKNARWLMMVQMSNTDLGVRFRERLWFANAKRRGYWDIPHDPGGPWHNGWPEWDELIPLPSQADLWAAWGERHPDEYRAILERRQNRRPSRGTTLRFKVFERDGFRCRYCGRGTPDVVLQADHVIPASKGGPYTMENLVTSCRDCNIGKRDRLLSVPVPA